MSGYTAFRRTTADGRHIVSAISRPGVFFGYSGIAGNPAAGELVAMTRATVGTWQPMLFRELLAGDPGLALSVIDAMSFYLVFITARIDNFIHQDARQRVLRVLAEHADLLVGEPPVLRRTMLPGLVGTSREMTGRVIRTLEAEGVIARIGRQGLRVLEPDALAAATAAAGRGT
jgi:CRP-like cAMP-binding protein